MRLEFFQGQVERLRKVYSPAAMNEERAKLLWERFKRVPDGAFESAVSHLISEFTSQSLPPMSRFSEAVGFFKGSGDTGPTLPAFFCEPCKDFGYGFIGDIVTRCTCHFGAQIPPNELVRQQKNYDRGHRLYPDPQSLLKAFGGDLVRSHGAIEKKGESA